MRTSALCAPEVNYNARPPLISIPTYEFDPLQDDTDQPSKSQIEYIHKKLV